MKIYFDTSSVNVFFNDNPFSSVVKKMYQHLQHVPVIFKPWDSPYYDELTPHDRLVDQLVECSSRLGLSVNRQKIQQQDQHYLNAIHKIYELKYDGNPTWLDFHEYIHLCEKSKNIKKSMVLNYREKAGILEKKFDQTWMNCTTTKIKAGDVFIQWAELGKTPYRYWKDSEPNDIDVLCSLAKPWLKLKSKIHIALEDFDYMNGIDDLDNFKHWWDNYQTLWCTHWKISKWDIKDIFAVGIIGNVDNLELVKTNLINQNFPTRVQM